MIPKDTAPPPQLLNQAEAAAAAAAATAANAEADAISRTFPSTGQNPDVHEQVRGKNADPGHLPDVEDVPSPPYQAKGYGQLHLSQLGLDTGARVGKDGRVDIEIKQRNQTLTNLLVPALQRQLDIHKHKGGTGTPTAIPSGLGADVRGLSPPPMNIVIQIVGSRGDVQPFIALGQVLKNTYGHRVRVATHPTFRDFVIENGLEFFSIGGDPAELMAFMVKNPGLMPGFDAMRNGDIGQRRKGIYQMIIGCWRSCIETGDGTGIEASDDLLDGRCFGSGIFDDSDPTAKPFVADAIIANPPSFAHMHIAEKLGIPLHLMFTMPWSATQAFPHPLANIQSTDCDSSLTNFISYALIDMMTWQGLGDVINRFRENTLNLEPVSIMWAPGMANRLRIPYTYCWSPALIPKPGDWGNHIDISGFYMLQLASNYSPPIDLADFLTAGPPPIYIGFGSIVVDDPSAMTRMIFDAVKRTGQRALVSKGWGGIGADELGIPDGVYMLENCPHDWLFKHVSCVVHHGGAGTSAAGISCGRPTVVVPFFGDQPFWGAMIARAGAGPKPIPYKDLTAEKLAAAIQDALRPESMERAAELRSKIIKEKGSENGAKSFHRQLDVDSLRCVLYPKLPAVWRVRRTDIRISALAAAVLGNEGLVDFGDLKLFRPREYDTDEGPWEPFTGAAAALIGTIGNMMMGVADFPVEMLKALRIAQTEKKEQAGPESGTSSSPPSRLDHGPPTRTASNSSVRERPTISVRDDEGLRDVNPGTQLSGVPTATSDGQSFSSTGRHDSQRGSRSSSAGRVSSGGVHDMSLGSIVESGKGVYRIASAGIKSPMDFTMALAKGFHNAPKLYGDDTVRKSERITGFQSGFKAVGKEFHYGFYDGITGLVTQPLKGAEKEGAAGFFKGAAKGIGGLILKPAAGIWGIPGYAAKGIYAELRKHFGSSVQNYIIAARSAQGYEEWKASTPEQRTMIINAWKSRQDKDRGRHQGYGHGSQGGGEVQEKQQSGSEPWFSSFKQTRHMSFDERKKLAEEKQRSKEEKKRHRGGQTEKGFGRGKVGCKDCPFQHDEGIKCPFQSQVGLSKVTDGESEEAIRGSVAATSKGDDDEDAMIERALRASVNELREAQAAAGGAGGVEWERQHLMSRNRDRDQSGDNKEMKDCCHPPQPTKTEVKTQTKNGSLLPGGKQPSLNSGMGNEEKEEDTNHEPALERSQRSQRTIPQLNIISPENDAEVAMVAGPDTRPDDDDDDDDIQRAIAESEKEHKTQQDELARQRTEEEIVLEYVKKQSLLEEEHRKNRAEQQQQQEQHQHQHQHQQR